VNPPNEYSTGASALLEALRGSKAQIWESVWSSFVTVCLADHAYNEIDFATGNTRPGLLDLDDPIKRSALVVTDETAIRDCADRLMESRLVLDSVLLGRGINLQSRTQLKRLLEEGGVVSALVDAPGSVATLTKINTPETWKALAHRIARSIHSDESSNNADPEWLLWNKLLLSRFFYVCRLAKAQEVAGQLKTLVRGFHGPRSSLLAITERISECGILDPSLPLVPRTGSTGIFLKGADLSDLLGAIQCEYAQMLSSQGIVHRTADPNGPASIPARLRDRLTVDQLKAYRGNAYRQHESAILSYGTLSAIEQLLRSLASRIGIRHLKDDGTPRPTGNWLARLGLSADLLARLQELYSADGLNLRNRAMHAGLLETSSRSLEVILAANPSGTGPTLSQDPYVAENLLNILIRDLEALDAYVNAVGLNTLDFSWTTQLWLTKDEVEFGHRISCDVLKADECEAWRTQLFSFIDHSLPCCATYGRIAWLGWLENFEPHNSLISFLAWGIVFEALYRQTIHVIGFDVIQRSPVNETNRMFQYRMLEQGSNGLCSPQAMAALVRILRPEERENAGKTIMLAIKARNALSHGAIAVHSEDGHFGAGHLFIKATQLLLAVIKEHMTREAAYYRFLDRSKFISKDPVEDWLSAEDDIYAIFERPESHPSA
jgi:hypothetical protein